MDNNKLRENLEELYLELLQLTSDEKSLQEKRDTLAARIQDSLAQEDLGGFQSSLSSLKELVEESLISFEVEHPKVTQMISRIENLLSSIGI
jgi:hypothetical protein